MKNISVYIWTIASLSLFAGGSITILFIFIPFWYSLQPTELMQWFTDFGPIVGITMLPMQIIPLLLSAYSYILSKKRKEEYKKLWLFVNLSNVFILIMFFAYFLPVNFLFVNQTMHPGDVTNELIRWEIMHVARTILSVLSFVIAIAAIKKTFAGLLINMKISC